MCPLFNNYFLQTLSNGVALSTANPYEAVTIIGKWRCLRLLREVMDEHGVDLFRAAVRSAPGLLDDLCAHDGKDEDGVPRHLPVPGVRITVEEVVAYQNRKPGVMP